MRRMRLEGAGFALILAGYLLVGALFAIYTPDWQAPDEPAHYNAIRQVAQHGCCPRIEPGDWDSAYLQRLTSARFAPEHLERLASVQYEDHQPPLYYLLASLVYRLGDGALLPLRMFSLLLGAGVVALSYVIARRALPGKPSLALLVMAFVAFLPQHMAMLAAVNNDALAELLAALGLLWILRYLEPPLSPPDESAGGKAGAETPLGLPDESGGGKAGAETPLGPPNESGGGKAGAETPLGPPNESGGGKAGAETPLGPPDESGGGKIWFAQRLSLSVWAAGLLAGGALLTKTTIYFVALLMALAIWLRWRGQGRPMRELARSLAVFALVAGLLGGLWWLRNSLVYGFPDVLGLGAHDGVVADQLRTSDYIAEHGVGAYLVNMPGTFFRSFVGQFGWMALPLDGALGGLLYRGFGLLLLAGALGAAPGARQIEKSLRIALLAAIALVAAQTLYYNLEFVQWQGRYFFPALIPVALLLVCGFDRWLGRWLRTEWSLLAGVALAAIDVYLLFRVIVPGLSP